MKWLLLTALFLQGCALEMTDMNNGAGYDKEGNLLGWGKGGIINPPNTSNKNPNGENNLSLQTRLAIPGVYTVQFSITPNPLPQLNGNIPVATIDWTTNGVTTKRKISVYDGASISGPAQFVKVVATDETEDPVHSGWYTVDMTVTPGTRGGTIIPTLQNVALERITSGSQHTFDIEQNVGAVLVRFDIGPAALNTTLDPTKFVIEFLDASSTGIATIQDPRDWIPIPPAAVAIIFMNNDAISADVKLVLGIDG